MMPRSDAELIRAGLAELTSLTTTARCLRDPVLWAAACSVAAAEQLLRVHLMSDQPIADAVDRQVLLEAIGNCRAATAAVGHALRDLASNKAKTDTLSGSGADLNAGRRPPGQADNTPTADFPGAVPTRFGPLEDDVPAEVER